MLLDALAHERKERSCIYAAKGVLCDSARHGAVARPTAADLLGISRGCQLAAIYGHAADIGRTGDEDRWNGKVMPAMKKAVDAHADSIRRSLDALA
jgi:hypothetical protein